MGVARSQLTAQFRKLKETTHTFFLPNVWTALVDILRGTATSGGENGGGRQELRTTTKGGDQLDFGNRTKFRGSGSATVIHNAFL